ncbi:MAG TPA: DegQ family serine endoprotease [Deltaproteobacteria bacterium]|nr:DegQ family serine endoprotease [Deltaproteobacteria bacterium]HPR54175.1 DegQ family serine endoprotease [Deltaproteobacteria bacterium]
MTKAICCERKQPGAQHIFIAAWLMLCLIIMSIPGTIHAQEKALEGLKETGKAFASVARQASPAVVFIKVEKTVTGSPYTPFNDDFFRRFFGEPMPGQPQNPHQQKRMVQGQGSGFIITPDGYILTNNHVVGDADKVLVKLLDGREFTAKTIGTDPPTDVAVIKIDAKNLPVLPLGDSSKVEVGEWVLALGNPFGLSHTLTAGIVSATGRNHVGISDYEDFIQTDAAINPGNSGGPLINLEGKVIGINTAIYSQSGGYMGIGFAIPVNMAKDIYDQLVKQGNVTRGYLGVMIQELTPEIAKSFGLKEASGVLVSDIMPGTPAEKAGLKQGDIIIRFNGEQVDTVAPFRNRVALMAPGTKADLTVIRDGRQRNLTVKIEKMPASQQVAAAASGPHALDTLGLSVVTLTKDMAEKYGYKGEKGLLVTDVDPASAAARAGIKPGMLIQEVNRKRVDDIGEFKKAVAGKESMLLLVKDRSGSRYITLQSE